MLQAHELAEINVPEEYLALNISAARFNIEKAAYLGFAKAQAKMGAAYELCQLGCDFNPALSLHYNALAARQGEPEADMAVSKWFLCGYEGLFEKNEELAFTYAQRAAQSGLPTAEFALGYFFEIGIFVSADLEESRSWYEKAAHHGNKDAVARIEGISRSKTLSRKDHENVAVAKIKSQYGSHRGKRPERFKNPSAPMPTIPDSMPEPELPRQRHGENSIYSHQSTNGSITPYPVDDGQRRPPPRAMNEQSYTNPGLPSNSISRPNSAAGSEVSFLDSNYRGSAYPTFQSQPHTSGENGGAGRGRGAPVNGPSGAQGPQGYRKPTSGYNSSNPPRSPPMDSARPQTPQPPAIDIGFSAPPDPRRQQRFDNPNLPTLGTLPGHPSNDISTSRRQDRLSSMPHPQTTYHRTDSPQRMPNSLGRQGVSLQDTPQRPDSAASLPNISSRTSKPDAPAATPPPSTPAARPPGKGPKTFQEMGVPATKNESDCVSRLDFCSLFERTDCLPDGYVKKVCVQNQSLDCEGDDTRIYWMCICEMSKITTYGYQHEYQTIAILEL